jgi:hypothetical protein
MTLGGKRRKFDDDDDDDDANQMMTKVNCNTYADGDKTVILICIDATSTVEIGWSCCWGRAR